MGDIYASQKTAWTAINGVDGATHSRFACHILPIRWSPAAVDDKLKIFRSLMGFFYTMYGEPEEMAGHTLFGLMLLVQRECSTTPPITTVQSLAPNGVAGTRWQCLYLGYFGFISRGAEKTCGPSKQLMLWTMMENILNISMLSLLSCFSGFCVNGWTYCKRGFDLRSDQKVKPVISTETLWLSRNPESIWLSWLWSSSFCGFGKTCPCSQIWSWAKIIGITFIQIIFKGGFVQ